MQRAAQEMGVSFEVRPPDGEPQPRVDPTELEPLVGAWRESLNASLANHISGPLEWREGMAPPYFTDKPAWDGYSALLIWAAHEEHPGSPLPDVAPDD